jgi:hypothetical protein
MQTLAIEGGLPYRQATAGVLLGWARSALGEPAAGCRDLEGSPARGSRDVGGLHQERHLADRLDNPHLALQRLPGEEK